MTNKPFIKHYVLIIILIVLTCLGCVVIFETRSMTDLIVFTMSVVSVLIAILAYNISIKTYVSIDAVNAISRMDGNVMESEGYRTNVAAQIRRFNAVEKEDVRRDLLEYIKTLFNGSNNLSGARLADNIQEVIDLIVLLPFIINSSNKDYAKESIKEIDELISNINKRISTFEQISEGSCILMKESIKLIEAVFAYQKIKPLETDCNSTLMDVRGTMLKNAVSRTVFYNYTGLLYLTKATEVILHHLNITKVASYTDIYDIDTLKSIKSCRSADMPELAVSHLETALENFNVALDNIKEDVMWNAFIKFNIARVEFLLNLISEDKSNSNWLETMNSAISYRKRLNLILSDILNKQEASYFQRAFIGEEYKARLQKIAFEIVMDSDITNIHNQTICPKSNYADILSLDYVAQLPVDEFNLFSGHMVDIKTYLEESKRES